jgi:DHA2 family multidrug resistance protein
MITLQAVIIAYIGDFKLLMILLITAIPLVLLLRRPARPTTVDHSAIME